MSQGVHLRKYGVETTIDFELYEIDGVDLRVDWVPVAADCEVMKDEGASTQCTNTATDEGSTYSIVLTATEMEAARLVLKAVDAATKVFLDKVIIIETYGHASAMHAMDFDDSVRAGLTALPNAAAEAAGGLYTRGTGAGQINQDANGRVDSNIAAISQDSVAADNLELDYDDTGYAKTNSTVGTITTLTGHTPQTGDSYVRLGVPVGASISADIAIVDGNVDSILTDTGTTIPASIAALNDIAAADVWAVATRLLTAGTNIALAKGVGVTGFNDLSAAQVNTECDTALSDYDGPTNTEMVAAFTEIKGATWASGTDTLEAIRDRGDTAWTTGAGGTPPDLLQNTTIATLTSQLIFTLTAGSADDNAYNNALVVITDQSTGTQKAQGRVSDYDGATREITLKFDPGIFTMAVGDTIDIIADGAENSINHEIYLPLSIDLADTASFRIGIRVWDINGDLIPAANLTAGTIAIARKAYGGTGFSNIVTDAACSVLEGLIFFDEVFDSGSGYAAGDSLQINFKSQAATVNGNVHNIISASGQRFFTYIRKDAAEAGDSMALTAATVTEIRDAILPEQNVALNNLLFLFVATSDHVTPVTGASGTGVTRSIDGGSFGAGTGTLSEIGNGIYQYDASAADMNGGMIIFRFTASGGTPGAPDDTFLTIVTGAGV